MEMDLFIVNSSPKEGILGKTFLTEHKAILNAGSGELTFEVQGRTIRTESHLPHLKHTKIPKIAGLSHQKEERYTKQNREDPPKQRLSIRVGKKRKRMVSHPRVEASTQTDSEYEKDRLDRLNRLVNEIQLDEKGRIA